MWFKLNGISLKLPPKNSQNDPIIEVYFLKLYFYGSHRLRQESQDAPRHLLRTRSTSISSVMVSVGVSKMRSTYLIFESILTWRSLAHIGSTLLSWGVSDSKAASCRAWVVSFLISQQRNAPAHRVHETINLLKQETPAFISPNLWPQTAQTWTRLTAKLGKKCSSSNGSTKQKFMKSMNWGSGG